MSQNYQVQWMFDNDCTDRAHFMIHPNERTCPKCHSRELKQWIDLSPDELIIAERMPASAKYTRDERKKHRICTRCWFEQNALIALA